MLSNFLSSSLTKIVVLAGLLVSVSAEPAFARGCVQKRSYSPLPATSVGKVVYADFAGSFGYQFCKVEITKILAGPRVMVKVIESNGEFDLCTGRLYNEQSALSIQRSENNSKAVANTLFGGIASLVLGDKATQPDLDCSRLRPEIYGGKF